MTVAEFRPAAAQDVDAVVPLVGALYAEDGDIPFVAGAVRANLALLVSAAALGELWVLASGEAVHGYMVLAFGFSLEHGGRDAFIDELYVAPGHRGQGCGRAALALAVERCRRRGIRAIHLEVELANRRAGELYRRCGFVEHGRRLMTLRIAPAP